MRILDITDKLPLYNWEKDILYTIEGDKIVEVTPVLVNYTGYCERNITVRTYNTMKRVYEHGLYKTPEDAILRKNYTPAEVDIKTLFKGYEPSGSSLLGFYIDGVCVDREEINADVVIDKDGVHINYARTYYKTQDEASDALRKSVKVVGLDGTETSLVPDAERHTRTINVDIKVFEE